jgi:hypothetical protein
LGWAALAIGPLEGLGLVGEMMVRGVERRP